LAFYKRSVFLINPSFQLKFSLIVTSLICISNMIYPWFIYDFFTGPQTGNLNPKSVVAFLLIVQFFVSILVMISLIFFTHKIAGPMYKLKKHLNDIREGQPISALTFRNGDYFPDVAEEVTLFLETVSSNQENDFQYVDEVSLYIENLSTVVPDDKKPVLNEISRRLLDIKSRYKKSL
jgi:hypothetical protein